MINNIAAIVNVAANPDPTCGVPSFASHCGKQRQQNSEVNLVSGGEYC